MPGTAINALHALPHLILAATLKGRYYYYLSFTEEKTGLKKRNNLLLSTGKGYKENKRGKGSSFFINRWTNIWVG